MNFISTAPMWYMNQVLIMLVRFSLQDPWRIHWKEAARLSQHWGSCASNREFGCCVEFVNFHFSGNIWTWVLFSDRSDKRNCFRAVYVYLPQKQSRHQVVHGWPFHVNISVRGMAAYPITATKEITQTRNLMKFLPVGKSSTETFQTPKLKQPWARYV